MALSKKRRNELKYICLAYPEKVKQIKEFAYINGSNFKQEGGNSFKIDTLEKKVIKLIELKKQVELIERACVKIFGNNFYQEALKNVTQGIPWEYLEMHMSRRSFYRKKTKLFEELDKFL